MSLNRADYPLLHLSPAAARLGRAAARPKAIAIVCIFLLTALGWLYLGLMTAGQATFQSLCRPAVAASSMGNFALVWSMWCAMTLAMMLPTAAPMLLTYAEIAETAARRKVDVVSPWVLAGGYLVIWLGFALAATVLQTFLARSEWFASGLRVSGLPSAALLIGAGLYQFSALKHACLRKCRQPFQFFFTRWTDKPAGVFRLGLQQGAYCLGCCWAMMLAMFAVGAMNIVWMAAIGIVMAIEKLGAADWFGRAVGYGLIGLGIAFVVT